MEAHFDIVLKALETSQIYFCMKPKGDLESITLSPRKRVILGRDKKFQKILLSKLQGLVQAVMRSQKPDQRHTQI